MVLDDREAIVGDSPAAPPETAPITNPSLFNTPKSSQDIRAALNRARERASLNNRTVKVLLRNVKRALDLRNAKRSGLEAKNGCLMEDFRALKPYTKRRVRELLNGKWMEDIIEAEEAAHRAPRRRKRAPR